MDILGQLKSEVAAIKQEVALEIRVGLLREDANLALSRLLTLDPDPAQQSRYAAALKALSDSP
jgi:hypothetical protein